MPYIPNFYLGFLVVIQNSKKHIASVVSFLIALSLISLGIWANHFTSPFFSDVEANMTKYVKQFYKLESSIYMNGFLLRYLLPMLL